MLIILTDITKERELQHKIERRQQLQKMVIAVATHKEETIELKNNFELFLQNIYNLLVNTKNITNNLNQLKRTLHTFKGQFAQKEMFHTTGEIHDIESLIEDEKLFNASIEADKLAHTIHQRLSLSFDQDLEVVSSILGEEFLSGKTYLHISTDRVEKLESQMLDLLYNIKVNNKKPLYDLLDNISNLRHSALVDLLGDYPNMVKNIALRLNKKVYPFKIEGDEDIFVSPNIKPFIETLVHVFRNAIDHGIENTTTREKRNKDPIGRVTCGIYKKGNHIQIIISDDGSGIDINVLSQEAIKQGRITQKELESYSEDDLLKLVFMDGFTTKDTVNDLSGRGIGLNSVFYELNKIQGKIEIINELNSGISFIFTVPNSLEIKENSLITQSEENFILNSVIKASLNFLEKDMNIAIVSKYSEQKLVLEKHFSTIKYTYSNEIFCIISMTSEVLERIFKVFIPDEIDQDQKNSLLLSIPDEIANIVCGLSISKFQELDEKLTMSEPILFDQQVITNLAQSNPTISNVIETIYGDFICTIINTTKE